MRQKWGRLVYVLFTPDGVGGLKHGGRFALHRRSNMGRIFAVFLPVLAQCLRMFNASKPKTMDYKSMLIGGLASALLFVSIGAGVQPIPWEEILKD